MNPLVKAIDANLRVIELEAENEQLRAALEAVLEEGEFDLLRYSHETRIKLIHASIFDSARQSAIEPQEDK